MAKAFIIGETYCGNCSAHLLRNESAWVSDRGSMVLCLSCLEEIHRDYGRCSHEQAIRHLYKFAMELGPNHPQAYVHAIEEAANRVGRHWFCKAGNCTNRNRYTSGYCGIHDVVLNEGKGVRIGGS